MHGRATETVILSNDFGAQKLDIIRDEFPDHFINCGISEQNQIGVGSGLAKFDLIPIFYSIASFYHRCAEQIKVDIAVPNLKSIFLGVAQVTVIQLTAQLITVLKTFHCLVVLMRSTLWCNI